MRYAFIAAHHGPFRATRLCRALGVSRSGYYAWWDRRPSRRAAENAKLLVHMRALHQRTKEAYGAVKLWRALTEEGHRCGRHRVARLRRACGLQTRRVRRFKLAYAARQSAPPAPNLLDQHFRVEAPDRVWVADVSFIPTRAGWLYLAVVLDLYSRAVIGWSMKERPVKALALDALTMALERRRPARGLIHHSDQGALYASGAYRELLTRHGIAASMSRKGNCYDNAVVESFFSTLKNELVHHCDFHTREEARAAIFEFIELFYNRQRLHQSLDYQPPMRYEAMRSVA